MNETKAVNNAPKRSRTSLDQAIDRKNNLSSIVESIWFEAYRRGKPHQWILDQIDQRVYKHRHWAKLPSWAAREVQGFSIAFLRAAQGWMLANVWIHDRVAYGNDWDKLPEHVRELIRKDQLNLTTIWAEYSQRFVDRPAGEVKVFSNG